MPFKKGQSGNPAGKKPGTPNKLAASVKEAIEQAFDDVGGVAYLRRIASKNPTVFCTLLGKVLPTQMQHSGAIDTGRAADVPPNETYDEWKLRQAVGATNGAAGNGHTKDMG